MTLKGGFEFTRDLKALWIRFRPLSDDASLPFSYSMERIWNLRASFPSDINFFHGVVAFMVFHDNVARTCTHVFPCNARVHVHRRTVPACSHLFAQHLSSVRKGLIFIIGHRFAFFLTVAANRQARLPLLLKIPRRLLAEIHVSCKTLNFSHMKQPSNYISIPTMHVSNPLNDFSVAETLSFFNQKGRRR